MDGTLMRELHGNLNALSEQSFNLLLKYFREGSLSSQEQSLLQNEITKLKDTWRVAPSPDLKSLTHHQETT
jgi:hypothetical protein